MANEIEVMKSEVAVLKDQITNLETKSTSCITDVAVINERFERIDNHLKSMEEDSESLSKGQLVQILKWFGAPAAVAVGVFGTAAWIIIAEVAERRADSALTDTKVAFAAALAGLQKDFNTSKVAFEGDVSSALERLDDEIDRQRDLIDSIRYDAGAVSK